jgi:hypothetical protein
MMGERKAFFLEKKEQRTFAPPHSRHVVYFLQQAVLGCKSSLVLSSKKERVSAKEIGCAA